MKMIISLLVSGVLLLSGCGGQQPLIRTNKYDRWSVVVRLNEEGRLPVIGFIPVRQTTGVLVYHMQDQLSACHVYEELVASGSIQSIQITHQR